MSDYVLAHAGDERERPTLLERFHGPLTVALDDASALEADGLRTMTDTMRAAGVDLALGPQLPAILEAAGADIVTIQSSASPGHGDGLAARIVAITIERFRARSISDGTKSAAIDAAISALRDPTRSFTGPTQWIVRARPMNRRTRSRL